MARKHIGRLSWGGVLALCAILLLAPETRSQLRRPPTKIKYVISGSVGTSGVTMSGFPVSPAPITDENGIYSVDVEYGWSGTVKPVKMGYTFDPAQRTYDKVTSNLPGEDYAAKLLTFTISGSVGLSGVKISGLPGEPISDESGRYTATVEFGWSGTAVPEKMGYRFEPSTQMYSQVSKDEIHNYKPYELKLTISGRAGVGGVTMEGFPGNPVTKADGSYSAEVGYAWNGKVTPKKEGHRFTPEYREYSVVTENLTNEDYQVEVFSYEISGTTGLPGVVLKGLPDEPVTDADGFYIAVVEYGWSGKVIPERAGYTFEPQSREYKKVVAAHSDQNYNPEAIFLTISGTAGTSNVTLDGLPGNPTSDSGGQYSVKVEYGWEGSVIPTKEGYSFEPASQMISPVTKDLKQNFRAQTITYKISGNVGQSGVMLKGLPRSPVSGPDGSYSDEVPWNWMGTVTPMKAGYTFLPENKEYAEVLSSLTSEDYTPSAIEYTISGRVTGEDGPLAEVLVFVDDAAGRASDLGPVSTDANGEFQLQVTHGWRGKIRPESLAHTFSPPAKLIDAVVQDLSNQNFTARIKMVTIINKIGYGEGADFEPVANVTLTAVPGGQKAVTGNDGKYTIRVPYAWTGELQLYKEGFEFDPNSIPFANVTEDIDGTKAPPPPPPPVTRDETVVAPDRTLPGPGPGTTPKPPDTTVTQKEQALQEISQVLQQLTAAQDQEQAIRLTGGQPSAQLQQTISELQRRLSILLAQRGVTRDEITTPPVPPVDTTGMALPGSGLIDALTEIMKQTGVNIQIDATVQNTPVAAPVNLAGVTPMTVGYTLQRILQGTDYRVRLAGRDTYMVFKGVTQLFQGDDLRQALQDLSSTAGVAIIPDPNVAGNVYADIRDEPLEKALEIMLAGTGYIVKREAGYILVADPAPGATKI